MISFTPEQLSLPWSAYHRELPSPKQRLFLSLPHKEAFFGGSAGGGKSSALLMGALQHVDVPGYHALILRKTLVDAAKPGAIMSRCRSWLAPTDARWQEMNHTWHFPAGSSLTFGGLRNENDAYAHFSTEYQYIAIDESTQVHAESLAEMIFTRLRRTRCPYHGAVMDLACVSCQTSFGLGTVPLRIRLAANPGGPGHHWHKARYRIDLSNKVHRNGKPCYIGQNPERPHIPAYIADNPYLDQESYIEQLSEITDPVTRERLLNGDWGVVSEGRFKPQWFRRWVSDSHWMALDGERFPLSELQTFIVIDPAASKAATPGNQELTKKANSHTVVSVWGIWRGHLLLLRVWRHQSEVPETVKHIRQALALFPRCGFVGMEYSPISAHLYQLLQQAGFTMKAFSPMTGDKIARSVAFAIRAEGGRVWLPRVAAGWEKALSDFEAEIFTWTGADTDPNDQVDVCSYAGIYVAERFGSNRLIDSSNSPSAVS